MRPSRSLLVSLAVWTCAHHPKTALASATAACFQLLQLRLRRRRVGRWGIMSETKRTSELILSWRDYLQETEARTSSDTPTVELILASQSPRRREILDMMGLAGRFRTVTSPLNEAALASELRQSAIDPSVYTRTLAEAKAMALAQAPREQAGIMDDSHPGPRLILASDTVVAWNDQILEKPVDAQDAVHMLQLLQGQSHVVHTGVALVRVVPVEKATHEFTIALVDSWTDTTTVQFAALTEADIQAYVATHEPMDKAGSYGIQGIGGQLVSSITGDFFTVMGLPMHRTSRLLAGAVADIVQATTFSSTRVD